MFTDHNADCVFSECRISRKLNKGNGENGYASYRNRPFFGGSL